MVGMGWIDIFFIRHFMDLKSLGIYSLSYRLMSMIQMLSTFIATVSMPILISFFTAKRTDLLNLYAENLAPKIIFLWSLFLSIVIYAASIVFPFMFAQDFQASLFPFYFLLCGLSFFVIFSVHSPLIQTYEIVHKAQRGFILSLGINIAGDVLLIPRIGIIGAAYSTAIAFFVLALWYYRLSRMTLDIKDRYRQFLYTLPAWVALPGIFIASKNSAIGILYFVFFISFIVVLARYTRLFKKEDSRLVEFIHMPSLLKRASLLMINFLSR
jgi:O-antigen/teichoic acid export membrane protein